MAAPPPAVPPNPPQQVTIPVSGAAGIGNLSITPPTFLEKWGVVFVSVGGIWMLGVCIAMLWYYLAHLSLPPAQTTTIKPEDYKALLDLHKTATDEFRDSLSFAFDLMVTKTILPLLTLLLGYLFGSKKS
jgi:hypothetical protein